MLLKDLLRNLAYGELSNLAIAMSGDGTIDEAAIPKVVVGVNEGLIDLHTKFSLNMKNVILQTYKHIPFYYLLPRYSQSQFGVTNEPYLYIMDLVKEPFQDDVLKIMHLYDDMNNPIPLNDSSKFNSAFTPQTKLLQLVDPEDDKYISVLYRAKHKELSPENLEEEIVLPETLHGALRAYVAYWLYGNLMTETSMTQSMSFKARYDSLCDQIILTDSVNNSVAPTDTKFEKRGFV